MSINQSAFDAQLKCKKCHWKFGALQAYGFSNSVIALCIIVNAEHVQN
jgi:hypothetical protein